jgi:hypothetical protein
MPSVGSHSSAPFPARFGRVTLPSEKIHILAYFGQNCTQFSVVTDVAVYGYILKSSKVISAMFRNRRTPLP